MKSFTPPLFVWLKNRLALYEVVKSGPSSRCTSVHSKMSIPRKKRHLRRLAILQFALSCFKMIFRYKEKVSETVARSLNMWLSALVYSTCKIRTFSLLSSFYPSFFFVLNPCRHSNSVSVPKCTNFPVATKFSLKP